MTPGKDIVDQIKVVVLAAGKGKRLSSEKHDLPKVLRQAAGRSLLARVLDKLDFTRPEDIIIVVGYKADMVRREIGPGYHYALQDKQLGTGHAVAAAAGELESFSGDVLIIYGDMPLFQAGTYLDLVRKHKTSSAVCTMLTAISETMLDYGRIIRDGNGNFSGIVEKKDCTPEQLEIKEVNPGVYVFNCPVLLRTLGRLQNNNAQGEYYLTDVPYLLQQEGYEINTHTIGNEREIFGVNTEEDLARAEKYLLENKK